MQAHTGKRTHAILLTIKLSKTLVERSCTALPLQPDTENSSELTGFFRHPIMVAAWEGDLRAHLPCHSWAMDKHGGILF